MLAEVKRLAAEMEQNHAGLETRLTADQDRFAGVLEDRLARIEALLSATAASPDSNSIGPD